jgi:hypothetical protein
VQKSSFYVKSPRIRKNQHPPPFAAKPGADFKSGISPAFQWTHFTGRGTSSSLPIHEGSGFLYIYTFRVAKARIKVLF